MDRQIGIIFDLDDTLLGTSPVYDEIIFTGMALITAELSPLHVHPEDMMKIFRTAHWDNPSDDSLLVEIDSTEILSSPYRFPKSLVKTYVECALRCENFPKEDVANKLYAMGMEIFSTNYRMMPGAKRLLDYLARTKRFRLFLVTLGEPELQVPKLQSKAVFRRFEKLIVEPFGSDKGEIIKKLRLDFDNIDSWIMVGDSIPVDINAALGAGIDAFHVVRNQGYHAEGDLITIGGALKRYRKFADLDEVRLTLEAIGKHDKEVPLEKRASNVLSAD